MTEQLRPQEDLRNGSEREGSPEAMLDRIQEWAIQFAEAARGTRDMLEIAAERGIPVDVSEALAPFMTDGESDLAMIRLMSGLRRVDEAMFQQGVLVTEKDRAAKEASRRVVGIDGDEPTLY